MSDTVSIIGGKPLIGTVTPIPNKNSLIPALPAALLTNQPVVYHQVPATSDVEKILEILKLLGVKVTRQQNTVTLQAKNLKTYKVDRLLGEQFRGSLMFAGPLLARLGKAQIPLPGGCLLGFRSITTHLDAFKAAGVKIKLADNHVILTAPKKLSPHLRIWQMEASVTATENLLMYLSGLSTQTELIEAACEPHVTDLENLLVNMGAKIQGIGSNRLVIKGSPKLNGAQFTPSPDFVDIAGYMVAAGITNGRITIKNANLPDIVDGLIRWMSAFGINVTRQNKDLVVSLNKHGLIIDPNSNLPLSAPQLPKLSPRPWPGFPVDVIPVMATLASKTKGRLLLQNWMYENGFEFVRELNNLGADIFISDPQRLIITGPVTFKGGEVSPPSVIQATKAIFLAALADPVTTTIHGVDILRRRYPDIFSVYRQLGASIAAV